jgi:hypothetical protein
MHFEVAFGILRSEITQSIAVGLCSTVFETRERCCESRTHISLLPGAPGEFGNYFGFDLLLMSLST